ncbi:MAG TPA: cation diffusion facilitator family transporter, partial [Rhodanobacteraceae bacterium]|nr:cation diffusion facilitator family transporter [Rhodanobacteraceae bacterium]
MARAFGSRTVVLAAFVGDLLIALAKFIAGGLAGSSAMLSEGVHSLVDTANSVLLLYGMHRARRPADADHPFGYGRELYFWSFLVALLVLALGAGISFYEGLVHLRRPEPLADTRLSYVVLAVSFVFEGVSWWVALKRVRARKGRRGYVEAFERSKDPADFIILMTGTAGLVGLLLALAGVTGSHLLGLPWLDGAASIGIAIVLAGVSVLLLRETKGLLIGEPAHPRIGDSIMAIARRERGVRCANGVLTFQMGADQVVANLSAEFEDGMNADQIEQCVNRIEDQVKRENREIVALFVKPQSARTWREHTR